MRLNAATDSANAVLSDSLPPALSSSSTPAYCGVGQHAHVLPVLGGAAHHGGAADVDVLDRVFQRATGLGHGGFKRVEVDHQQVDGVDAVVLQRRHVLGHIAPRQQAAMHLGVQGLDAAVQHLGEAGDFGHLGHGQALVGQQLGGAAGGDELDAQACSACASSTMPVLSETEMSAFMVVVV
jgi:hypothetical protein